MAKTMGKPKKEKEKRTVKTVFEEKITCPYCEESIILRKEKHLLKAGQPAEYQEKLVIDKDAQKTIEQSAGPKLDTKSKGKGDDV